jgi:hypothetical protein
MSAWKRSRQFRRHLAALPESRDEGLGYTESAGIGLTDTGVDDDEFIHTDCFQTKIQLFHDMAFLPAMAITF